jgi:hypothetical protein
MPWVRDADPSDRFSISAMTTATKTFRPPFTAAVTNAAFADVSTRPSPL